MNRNFSCLHNISYVIIIIILCLTTISCKKDNIIPYNDVVFFNIKPNKISSESTYSDKKIIILLKNKEEVVTCSSEYEIRDEITSIYDEKFFTETNLIFIAFQTSSSQIYKIKSLITEDNNIIVNIKKTVNLENLDIIGLGLFIEVNKDDVNNVAIFNLVID